MLDEHQLQTSRHITEIVQSLVLVLVHYGFVPHEVESNVVHFLNNPPAIRKFLSLANVERQLLVHRSVALGKRSDWERLDAIGGRSALLDEQKLVGNGEILLGKHFSVNFR